jgi:hypothetical protein
VYRARLLEKLADPSMGSLRDAIEDDLAEFEARIDTR